MILEHATCLISCRREMGLVKKSFVVYELRLPWSDKICRFRPAHSSKMEKKKYVTTDIISQILVRVFVKFFFVYLQTG